MTAATPFIGKWQLVFDPPDGSGQRVFTLMTNNPNEPDLAVFSVYQQRRAGDDLATTSWILPEKGTPRLAYGRNIVGLQLYFSDGSDNPNYAYPTAQLTNPPVLPPAENPAPNSATHGPLGVWGYDNEGGWYFFGWPLNDPPITAPVQASCAIQVVTPGALYIRQYYGGIEPAGSDFSYVDISGEDYSGLILNQAQFLSCLCSGTKFDKSMMLGATFGGNGSLVGATFSGAFLGEAQFQGLDLTDADFSGADLAFATFAGCTLRNAVFNASQLQNVQFINCDLTGADFTDFALPSSPPTFAGCILDNANFSPRATTSDLSGVNLGSAKSIAGCSFANAKLVGTNFDKLALTGVDFTGADLTGTVLINTDLRPAKFSQPPGFSTSATNLTDLSGSTVGYQQIGTNWSYLNLSAATIADLPTSIAGLTARSSILSGVELTALNLTGADFTGADLRQSDLSNSNLANATFAGARLDGDDQTDAAVLSGALLENADFTGANLTGAQFAGAYLWGDDVSLSQATVIRTNFANAYLTGIKFVDVAQKACQGATFTGACLVNAVFNGTDCGPYQGQPASFESACLQGADFTNASLDGADLNDAAVAAAGGTITVTLQIGWPPQPVPVPLTFGATLGLEGATDNLSICPNGQQGPCSAQQQTSPNAPTAWPSVAAGQGSK